MPYCTLKAKPLFFIVILKVISYLSHIQSVNEFFKYNNLKGNISGFMLLAEEIIKVKNSETARHINDQSVRYSVLRFI